MSVRPSVRPSVCPHGTTRLPLDGFSWNLIFGYISKICLSNSSFVKWDKYRGYFIHFWSHLAQFFVKWEMFQKKMLEKIKTILYSITFFKSKHLEVKWQNNVERGKPQITIWRPSISRCVPKAKHTHSEYVVGLLFHCNIGCTNAPQCYVFRTLPVHFLVYTS